MRNFITGGAGFIGSHLAERLLARGDEVYVIDNLSTGKLENIAHLRKNPNFHFTLGSISEEHLLHPLVEKCDIVYHLAAAVGVRLIIEKPVETIETNILGTEMVLKVANQYKKKVIIASTSEVYGKTSKVPFREDDDSVYGPTTRSRWSYACSKAIDEFLALAYYHEKKLPIVILRLFNTIGPRQTGKYGMVVPTFVQQALLNHPITVFGDGSQARSFTYVDDVVTLAILLAEDPRAEGEVFNVGNGKEITIKELALKIKEMISSKSDIVHIPYDQAYERGFEDMQRRIPDISKAIEYTGYQPQTSLSVSLQKIIEYQRQ
ncbi:MAG: nucleoside-diphosphate sugar epimerase [candidate division Zixibacteria bacterium RBG_16_48_11]|nr:MAG: nucleoside-diphosphate sugar epimerase [candidate division Zixibacteria bacterium RBG_16_48_11]